MNTKKVLTATALFFGLSTAAVAFPWDIDMVDSLFVRGYEAPMENLPEGVVSQNNYRPTGYENLSAEDQAAVDALKIIKAQSNLTIEDPYAGKEADQAVLLQGETAFTYYCQTCHGYKGTGKTRDLDPWPLQSTGRFVGIPNIYNLDKNTLGKFSAGAMKSKEELYLIIRNGRNRMPSYGHAMSENEIWSAIHYIKSLSGQDVNAKIGEKK
jgi:mono/diheme cytochrome c family protein